MFKPKTQKIENIAKGKEKVVRQLEGIFNTKTRVYIDYANGVGTVTLPIRLRSLWSLGKRWFCSRRPAKFQESCRNFARKECSFLTSKRSRSLFAGIAR